MAEEGPLGMGIRRGGSPSVFLPPELELVECAEFVELAEGMECVDAKEAVFREVFLRGDEDTRGGEGGGEGRLEGFGECAQEKLLFSDCVGRRKRGMGV